MTGERNGSPAVYRLSISGEIATQIKDAGRRATQRGQKDEFIAALAAIERRLKTAPLDFGALVRDLPGLGLIVHVGRVAPLSVRFAIDQANRIVYIRRVILLGT